MAGLYYSNRELAGIVITVILILTSVPCTLLVSQFHIVSLKCLPAKNVYFFIFLTID